MIGIVLFGGELGTRLLPGAVAVNGGPVRLLLSVLAGGKPIEPVPGGGGTNVGGPL
jgi:hypothetical protein